MVTVFGYYQHCRLIIQISSHFLATFGIWLPMQWTTWIVWQMGSTSDDRRKKEYYEWHTHKDMHSALWCRVLQPYPVPTCGQSQLGCPYRRLQAVYWQQWQRHWHQRESTVNSTGSSSNVVSNHRSTSSICGRLQRLQLRRQLLKPPVKCVWLRLVLRLHLYRVVTRDFVAIALIRCVPWMLLVRYAACTPITMVLRLF